MIEQMIRLYHGSEDKLSILARNFDPERWADLYLSNQERAAMNALAEKFSPRGGIIKIQIPKKEYDDAVRNGLLKESEDFAFSSDLGCGCGVHQVQPLNSDAVALINRYIRKYPEYQN